MKKLLVEEDESLASSDSEDDDWLPRGDLPHNSRSNEYFAALDNEEESDYAEELTEHVDSKNQCQN